MSILPVIFDRASFQQRMMGDWELCVEVLGDFLDDLPKQLADLSEMQAAGNLDGVAIRAHTIKGASANVSAEALRDVALRLELAAKQGEALTLPACVEALFVCAENTRIVLEKACQV